MLRIHDIRKRESSIRPPLLLNLSVVSVFFVTFAAIFDKIASEVMEGDTQKIDESLLLAINSISSSLLDQIMVFVTTFGGVAFISILTATVVIYFWRQKQWRSAVFVAFAVGGVLTANSVLKLVFQRDRPSLWSLLVSESTYSFPSGHAALSCTVALTAVILLWHSKWRKLAIIAACIYVITIGFTRLYLGVHYPTDILAGWLVAVTWVLTVGFIMGIVYFTDWRQSHRG